ncbi:MAG TPA: hypothetical protein VHS96_16510, partial [Bacteroidia bacterium]|nr:hypothetical protein [Bacteroidia bacterium]
LGRFWLVLADGFLALQGCDCLGLEQIAHDADFFWLTDFRLPSPPHDIPLQAKDNELLRKNRCLPPNFMQFPLATDLLST